MCVCVCVCVCQTDLRMSISMYGSAQHTCGRACPHAQTHTYTRIHTHKLKHTYTHTHTPGYIIFFPVSVCLRVEFLIENWYWVSYGFLYICLLLWNTKKYTPPPAGKEVKPNAILHFLSFLGFEDLSLDTFQDFVFPRPFPKKKID